MKTRTVTYDSQYEDKPIITNEQLHLGCDRKILNEAQRQFDAALNDNSKTFFFRFDIRFPSDYTGTADNSAFSKFQATFIRNLTRQGLNPRYIAVREQSKEKHAHYHEVILLNGQKTQCIYKHIRKAEDLW